MTGAQLQTLPASLSGEEQALIDALRRAFGVDFSIVDSSPASPTSIETNTEVDASGDADHQSLYRLVEAARAGAESHSEILNVSHSGDVTLGTLSGRRRVVCVTSRLRRSTMTAVGVVASRHIRCGIGGHELQCQQKRGSDRSLCRAGDKLFRRTGLAAGVVSADQTMQCHARHSSGCPGRAAIAGPADKFRNRGIADGRSPVRTATFRATDQCRRLCRS